MKLTVLDSRFDCIEAKELSAFIEEVDLTFINRLCERETFPGYDAFADKLLSLGMCFFIRDDVNGELVAFTAAYADPNKYKYAHVPFTGVRPIYQNKGFSRPILEKKFEELKKIGMGGVIISCSKENMRMMRRLESAGLSRILDIGEIANLKNNNEKDNWDKVFYKLEF